MLSGNPEHIVYGVSECAYKHQRIIHSVYTQHCSTQTRTHGDMTAHPACGTGKRHKRPSVGFNSQTTRESQPPPNASQTCTLTAHIPSSHPHPSNHLNQRETTHAHLRARLARTRRIPKPTHVALLETMALSSDFLAGLLWILPVARHMVRGAIGPRPLNSELVSFAFTAALVATVMVAR